jgi:transcriptional antiterminator RfaH
LQPQRAALATHCLRQAGFQTYCPRIREPRTVAGRKVVKTPLPFPGYLFVLIELQWHTARWAPGVVRFVLNGGMPAAVPDGVIASLRRREVDGLIELPRPARFRTGDPVRVTAGPLAGQLGLFQGMKPKERVEVLLAILGGEQRVTLAADAVEPA